MQLLSEREWVRENVNRGGDKQARWMEQEGGQIERDIYKLWTKKSVRKRWARIEKEY